MKCAVITPIGPGHMELYDESCTPSINAAIAYSTGPFDEVIPIAIDDTEGSNGRSKSRNIALDKAAEMDIDWVFFLDADDLMAPNAFEAFGRVIKDFSEVEAVWGQIVVLDDNEQPQLRENQREWIVNRSELLGVHPYHSLQMGFFGRTELVRSFGFDVDMDAGEDFKLYFQLWRSAHCTKVPEIFFINRQGMHSEGPRSASGRDWVNAVTNLWANEVSDTRVKTHVCHGDTVSPMRLTNPKDLIQSSHALGHFFESEALDVFNSLLPPGARSIIDVGANIGNHTVYFAKHASADVVYPIEPNPEAIALLRDNITLNQIDDRIDPRGIGYGVGSQSGRYQIRQSQQDNLGSTSIEEAMDGDLEVRSLDDLIGQDPIHGLKIDAEGMEFDVLEGARGLIARERPLIWVEILRPHTLEFAQRWCRENDYRIVYSFPYANTVDYFAAPKEKS